MEMETNACRRAQGRKRKWKRRQQQLQQSKMRWGCRSLFMLSCLYRPYF